MAAALGGESCVDCHAGTPALPPEEVEALRAVVDPSWAVVDDGRRLRRRIKTPDFGSAFAIATRVGFIAEAQRHHPDLGIGWGRLDIDLTTHAISGLTRNDFILAARIDAALR